MIHNPELYQPATDVQLRQFTNKLGYIANKLSGPLNDMQSVEFDARISFGEGDVGRISYFYEIDDDSEIFTVTTGRLVPIDKTWSRAVAETIMGEEFSGLNDYEENMMRENSYDEISAANEERYYKEDYGDSGIVEGYLEHESKLDIIRTPKHIDAKKSTMFNVLDDQQDEFDAHFGHFRNSVEESVLIKTNDLENLYRFGESMLTDIYEKEEMLSVPTTADLIVCINGLISSGFLSAKTIAFKGAKPFMGLKTLPNIYI
ncbi:MAG: hypothetical protein WCJ60_03380 [bacterium]